MEGPPPVPADVTSQQGMPFAGVGEQMAADNKPPATAGPQGALQAKIDAVKKVMQGVVEEAKGGKPFFSRALELLDKGMQAEAGGSAGVSGPPETSTAKPEGPANPAFPG